MRWRTRLVTIKIIGDSCDGSQDGERRGALDLLLGESAGGEATRVAPKDAVPKRIGGKVRQHNEPDGGGYPPELPSGS